MQLLNLLVFILVSVGLLLAVIWLGLWKLLLETANEKKCSQCGKNWPAASQDEELIGIFQKAHHKGKASYYGDNTKMIWYGKYKLYYQCKYCGHKWILYKSKKL